MKKIITTIVLALLTVSFTYAIESTPDSMYVHFTGSNGDSIVVHAIDDVDSIVYYAPIAPQGIDWSSVSAGDVQPNALTDTDGNSYSAVKIGEQVWMAENLNVTVATVDTTGGSADLVCQLKDVFVWSNTDVSYGKLYSYEAALKACPAGWHLPSDGEWKVLEISLGMSQEQVDWLGDRGTDLGSKLKATTGWSSSACGNNSSGFSALPGGAITDSGEYFYQSDRGEWWSGSQTTGAEAYYRELYFSSHYIRRFTGLRYIGLSVRCLRD